MENQKIELMNIIINKNNNQKQFNGKRMKMLNSCKKEMTQKPKDYL